MHKYICTHTHTHITMPPVRAAHNKHHSPKERKAQSIADDLWWDSSIAKREEEENVSFPSLPNTSLSIRFFSSYPTDGLLGMERVRYMKRWRMGRLQWIALANPF